MSVGAAQVDHQRRDGGAVADRLARDVGVVRRLGVERLVRHLAGQVGQRLGDRSRSRDHDRHVARRTVAVHGDPQQHRLERDHEQAGDHDRTPQGAAQVGGHGPRMAVQARRRAGVSRCADADARPAGAILKKRARNGIIRVMGTVASSGSERRALVVEDDEDIRALIEFTLTTQGFAVTAVDSGLAGVDAARSVDPDLITLDLGLPGIDGIEVCRRIREFSDAYIVMITARDDEIDRLLGLETGADDFIAKPFSARELKARVNAMFRRPRTGNPLPSPQDAASGAANGHEVLEHGGLRLDVDGRRAFRGEEELVLTRTEFDLLTELMRTPARVWSREALLRSVWGTEWASDTHLVEVHIGNLRRKLSDGGDIRYIRTVRGIGYRMELAD